MRISWEDLTHQFVLPLWTEKALTVVDNFVAPAADIRTTFSKGSGPKVLKQNLEKTFKIVSSFEFTIHETLPHENKFIYKWSGKVTDNNITFNIQSSREKIVFSGITALEIDGRFITHYHCFSDLPQVIPQVQYSPLTGTSPQVFSEDLENIITTIKHTTGKRLTKREIECLSLWLKGFSIKETAKFLGNLSHRTIQTFRENIKRKLNVETYQQLFNLVYKNGLMALLL